MIFDVGQSTELKSNLNHIELLEKFSEWKDWEVNVSGEMYSPQCVRFFDSDLFIECARQGNPFPGGTIWNEDYFWEHSEATGRFILWLNGKLEA